MKRRFILWLMQTKAYKWLLMHVIPYIRFTTYYTDFTGLQYHSGYKLLKPGDIILTTDKKKLTTLLIPGEFTHAALCVGKDGEWEVSEMTHDDYVKSCFFDVCKQADRVVILRCKDWKGSYIDRVIWNCKMLQDAKYDIQFNLGVKALYCSELVYQSDREKKLQVSLEDLAGIGRPYISPTGIYKAKNVKVIWDSKDVPTTLAY